MERYVIEPRIVKVTNIWGEQLYDWFYHSVIDAGGDGDAALVCKNYKEVAERFYDAYLKKFNHYSRIEGENSINFTDMSNENFIFSNDPDIKMYGNVFIVEKTCEMACNPTNNPEKCFYIEGL